MMMSKFCNRFALTTFAILTSINTANAGVINFDFNSLAAGAGTPITLNSGGVDATFSASGDPGGFSITPSFFSFPGNVIYTPGTSGQNNEALNIKFSSPLTAFSGNFATNGSGPLNLTAFIGGTGGTTVGSSSATGITISNFPEGIISFSGANFDTIVLADNVDPNFALGSFQATTAATTVPEPASIALIGLGLAAAAFTRRRKP